jgi:hypothetical protein
VVSVTEIERIRGAMAKYREQGQRYGQAAWNAVSVVRPDLANRFGDLDPFHDDVLAPVFLNMVAAELEAEAAP